jgi:hypothetical protein
VLGVPTARADATRAQCTESYERAQYARREAKLTEAREALLVCSQDSCPTVVKNDCVPWLAEVERSLPSVVVAVRDASGKDLANARFSIDGGPATPVDGRPLTLDPGPHKLKAITADGQSAEEQVVVRAGEKTRALTLVVTSAGSKGAPADKPLTDPPTEATPGRSIALPLTLTAVGAVGLGASLLFGLQAKSEADDVRTRCAPHCKDSDLDGVHTKLLLSDIGLGVGVLALAAATYFWLSAPSSAKASAPTSTLTAGGRRGSFTIRF